VTLIYLVMKAVVLSYLYAFFSLNFGFVFELWCLLFISVYRACGF